MTMASYMPFIPYVPRAVPYWKKHTSIAGSDIVPALQFHPAHADDFLEALSLQEQFDQEHEQLVLQRDQLLQTSTTTFACPLCLEDLPEDDIVYIDQGGCKHKSCRSCLAGYMITKIKDRMYPITCPICVADGSRKEPSTLGNEILHILDIADEDLRTYQEMELTAFSVMVHCRGCEQTLWVDRAEYNEEQFITCPLPDCLYTWCKNCSLPVDLWSSAGHSCDGSVEMERLAQSQGWKSCPGCKTIIQKADGCNHMTCTVTGCNTHFCYKCGELIVKSTDQGEIKRGLDRHYSGKCGLFDVPV